MDMAAAKRKRDGKVKVTSQGQVSIPRDVMREAGIKPGDELQASVDEAGRIVMQRTLNWVEEFAGSAPGGLTQTDIRKMRDEWDR